MKVYEVVFDKDSDKGVYALSCVENPAMEDTWLTLAEHHQEIQFAAVDEEKRLLLGAALIPNKKVYRNIDGEEFYITFSEKTIEDCAHAFMKNGFQNNSSTNHEVKLEGVSVVEAWIVQDPKNDKSNAFGKEYEKGTWVTMMKVDNDDAWKNAKEGKLTGFSIDGLFSLKELNLKSNIMSDKKTLKDSFIEVLQEFGLAKQEVKMGQLKLKDGKTTIEFEGEKPELGMPVFVLSTEGGDERFRAPEGEHELESGEMLFVDANGLVAEEQKEDVKAEPVVKTDEIVEAMKHVATELKSHFEARFSEMEKSFKIKLSAEKKKNEELELKLEKVPAEAKIVKLETTIEQPKTRQERLFNVALEALN